MPHSPASARGLCLRLFCSTLFGFQVKNSLLRGYGFQLGFTRIMDVMENSLGSAKGRRGQTGQDSANGNTADANRVEAVDLTIIWLHPCAICITKGVDV